MSTGRTAVPHLPPARWTGMDLLCRSARCGHWAPVHHGHTIATLTSATRCTI